MFANSRAGFKPHVNDTGQCSRALCRVPPWAPHLPCGTVSSRCAGAVSVSLGSPAPISIFKCSVWHLVGAYCIYVEWLTDSLFSGTLPASHRAREREHWPVRVLWTHVDVVLRHLFEHVLSFPCFKTSISTWASVRYYVAGSVSKSPSQRKSRGYHIHPCH